MTTEQLVLVLVGVALLAALWAAVFATRADRAARAARALADRRWDDSVRPHPTFSFGAPPAPGQPIEVGVENLGGTLTSGAVVVQAGDDLYAAELALPEKAPARRILLMPVMKAWQKLNQPKCLLLAGRDISSKWWDCLDGGAIIAEPPAWLDAHLLELRLHGVVDFPAMRGAPKPTPKA